MLQHPTDGIYKYSIMLEIYSAMLYQYYKSEHEMILSLFLNLL